VKEINEKSKLTRRDFIYYQVLIRGLLEQKKEYHLIFDSILESLDEKIVL
jgi:hypothetical protein